MIVEVLAADTVAMRIRIISPTEDPRIWDISWEKTTEPVHAVRRRPSFVAVSIQTVDGNDARKC
jgi:hypothetical protein